jgi:hypothetical protein
MKKDKVATVMREFKSGELKSSSGKKVTNPKQAIAIGLSEAGMSKPKMKEGGQVNRMKSKGEHSVQTKSKRGAEMVKMAKGGDVKKYRKGGSIDGCATKGKTKGTMVKMAKGGKVC